MKQKSTTGSLQFYKGLHLTVFYLFFSVRTISKLRYNARISLFPRVTRHPKHPVIKNARL